MCFCLGPLSFVYAHQSSKVRLLGSLLSGKAAGPMICSVAELRPSADRKFVAASCLYTLKQPLACIA